jgi:hypothetical protein
MKHCVVLHVVKFYIYGVDIAAVEIEASVHMYDCMQYGIRSAVNRTQQTPPHQHISRQLPLRNLWPLYDQKYWKTLRRVCR